MEIFRKNWKNSENNGKYQVKSGKSAGNEQGCLLNQHFTRCIFKVIVFLLQQVSKLNFLKHTLLSGGP